MQQLWRLIFNSAAHVCLDFDSSSTPTHARTHSALPAAASAVGVPKKREPGRLVLAARLIKGGRIGPLLSQKFSRYKYLDEQRSSGGRIESGVFWGVWLWTL